MPGGGAFRGSPPLCSLFRTVCTLGCVWLQFLAGGAVLGAGEQPKCIAQVALWPLGTDALRLVGGSHGCCSGAHMNDSLAGCRGGSEGGAP